ncbi:hypothetical protein KUCAC02_010456, partial [Chaenocephalus aceratus]
SREQGYRQWVCNSWVATVAADDGALTRPGLASSRYISRNRKKSSNLPSKVLQFNFSIVRGDNPVITGEEVALSPGQR